MHSEDDLFFEPKLYRLGNPNLVLFHGGHFLILPRSEVFIDDDGMMTVEQEMLDSAFDVTPDLPPRILGSAWKHHIVFKTEIDLTWAVDIARSCNLSAQEIAEKFMEV